MPWPNDVDPPYPYPVPGPPYPSPDRRRRTPPPNARLDPTTGTWQTLAPGETTPTTPPEETGEDDADTTPPEETGWWQDDA